MTLLCDIQTNIIKYMHIIIFVVSESDGYEFMIVSLDNKQWHFEAQNSDVSKMIFCILSDFLLLLF